MRVRGRRVQVVDEESGPPTKRFGCMDCAFTSDHAVALAAHKRCKYSTYAEASWWHRWCRAESSEEEDLPALEQSDKQAEDNHLFCVPVSANARYSDANQA